MPKFKRGTRILDPQAHAQAMCAQLVVSLVLEKQDWSIMARFCNEQAQI